jgi:diadenosine tetraphosphate (Ap4A) HIT family hydrolase
MNVKIENARTEDYGKRLLDIAKRGICPFCMPHLKEFFPEDPLYENMDWYLFKNQVPQKNTLYHLLVIAKAHGTRLTDIAMTKTGNSFFDVVAWAEKNYKLPGGAVGFRFGDMNYSAGTVSHSHAQIIVPDIDSLKEGEFVALYIGKPLKKS